jgi:hypothetical protein
MAYDFRTLALGVAAGFLFMVGVPACSSTLGRINKCTHLLDSGKVKAAAKACNTELLFLDKK